VLKADTVKPGIIRDSGGNAVKTSQNTNKKNTHV